MSSVQPHEPMKGREDFAVITMVAETEGSPDNTGEIIVLFKKNDIILARLLPGHEMLDLSLCMEE